MARDVMTTCAQMHSSDNPRIGEARIYLGICPLRRGGDQAGARALTTSGRSEFTQIDGQDHDAVRSADIAYLAS